MKEEKDVCLPALWHLSSLMIQLCGLWSRPLREHVRRGPRGQAAFPIS